MYGTINWHFCQQNFSPILGHQNPGSGSVFSLKCWIRIKWIRIWNTGYQTGTKTGTWREHPALQIIQFLNFFLFFWFIFALLDPEPDPADQNQCWSTRIRIRTPPMNGTVPYSYQKGIKSGTWSVDSLLSKSSSSRPKSMLIHADRKYRMNGTGTVIDSCEIRHLQRGFTLV